MGTTTRWNVICFAGRVYLNLRLSDKHSFGSYVDGDELILPGGRGCGTCGHNIVVRSLCNEDVLPRKGSFAYVAYYTHSISITRTQYSGFLLSDLVT